MLQRVSRELCHEEKFIDIAQGIATDLKHHGPFARELNLSRPILRINDYEFWLIASITAVPDDRVTYIAQHGEIPVHYIRAPETRRPYQFHDR